MAVLTAHRDVRRLLKEWPGIWVILSVVLFWGGQDLRAETTAPKEYQVKAVFLYNFSQFVKWPAEAIPQAQMPLVIGILGDDPFGAYLDQIVSGEKMGSHPLVIQRYRQLGEIKGCQVLFISQSESKRVQEILSSLKDRNILTVSELEGFNRAGGIIRFVTRQNKIRFKINLDAAKEADLTLSSKLLQAAEKD